MTAVVAPDATFKPIVLRLHNATFVLFRVLLTGNYVALGDPMSLGPLYRYGSAQFLKFCVFYSKAGYIYQWDQTNKKFMVRIATTTGANIGLAEHSAAAYNAAVLADEIYGLAIFSGGL